MHLCSAEYPKMLRPQAVCTQKINFHALLKHSRILSKGAYI